MSRPDCTLFATTSGHSGVDRLFTHLVDRFAAGGLRVDLLQVRNHGPNLDVVPSGARVVPLGVAHASTSLPAVVRYLRRERPRVLLSDKDKVNRVALFARWLARVDTRVAVRIGTSVSTNLASKRPLDRFIQRWSIRLLYRFADRIIVPSAGAADDLAAVAGIARPRITVLPNAVVPPDLEHRAAEAVDEPWARAPDEPLLVTAGALIDRKDIPTQLHALAALRRRLPARLVILGRGPKRDQLVQLAEELGLRDSVHFAGFTANPYAWMARADCYVQSSRWEGFGIALVEALALGIPVVSTDCPSGPSEILEDGRHGRLVPVGDVAALAGAIEETLSAPPDPAGLRAAARPYTVARSARAYRDALGLAGTEAADGDH